MSIIPEHRMSRDQSFNEREADFYMNSLEGSGCYDATLAVGMITKKVAQILERVVGTDLTEAMFASLIKPMQLDGREWREIARETHFQLTSQLGNDLISLAGYAVYGLVSEETDRKVGDTISAVEELLEAFPLLLWDEEEEPDGEMMLQITIMARARWNLDNGFGVTPEGLALLGGVKLSRIRNLMAGDRPELPRDPNGDAANLPARAWLEKHESFLPTMFKADDHEGPPPAAEQVAPIFLPVARDGSMFTPDLALEGYYRIGEIDAERQIESFADALAALQAMPVPKWRRPDTHGRWDWVHASEWRRVGRTAFRTVDRRLYPGGSHCRLAAASVADTGTDAA